VVTGSTDGIGKSYAELLAKKGMNIVLISRSPEKLKTVANEIRKYSSIDMKCLAVDFSLDLSMYKKIGDELKGLDIGVLVNNVGMSHNHPEFLLECNDKDLENMVNINCFSVVFMTKLVLAQMVEKKKGLIINISSLSAHQSTPLLATYAATKAFVRLFSKCVEAEYKSNGIIVQCVSPGFVATKMSKIKKASFMVPGADKFASSALSTAGLHSDVTGHFSHELMVSVLLNGLGFFNAGCFSYWIYVYIILAVLIILIFFV
ncbi:hypothetical protein HELRODRAFT_83511, partial [Helobdella robusta]|uniref:Uncharacterized protein n=1 Tax=Helobdella robusta TaxID=6412 RepID=T1G566_HELRO